MLEAPVSELIAELIRKKQEVLLHFQPDIVHIEKHALEKFLSLHPGNKPKKPEKTLRKLLKDIHPKHPSEMVAILGDIRPNTHVLANGRWKFLVEETGGKLKVADVFYSYIDKSELAALTSASKTLKIPKTRPYITPNPEIPLPRVRFTNHALDQFKERFAFYEKTRLENPERAALALLSGAAEDDAIDPVKKVKRIITHEFEVVRYFRNGSWRFVIRETEEEILLVLTIERTYY